MKKLFVVSLTMSLLNLDLAVTAQTPAPKKKTIQDATVYVDAQEMEKSAIEKKNFGTYRLNNINVRAVRDFEKSFAHASEKQWFILKDGLVVYFKINDVEMKTFYDKKGGRILTLSFYGEEKLPFAVRDLVKRNYYDFNITQVIEINKDNHRAYLVKMEDKCMMKTVRVANDEYVEIESFRKPK